MDYWELKHTYIHTHRSIHTLGFMINHNRPTHTQIYMPTFSFKHTQTNGVIVYTDIYSEHTKKHTHTSF